MHSRFASFVLITILAVVITPFAVRGTAREADQGKTQAPAKKESNKKTEQGSALTGCVDQQDGQYVLVDERNREAIADLIAEGFPTEGFAKHVGHKVTIRGTSSTGGTRTVMKVRSIETVSETCGPQEAGKH